MNADSDLSIIEEKLKQNEVQDLKNSDFISDITSRKYELVSVIESLSDVLTNQDVTIRERGVSFLSWVLDEVPSDLFNSQEISAIVSFYCDRLKDHPNLASATMKGLLALVKMKNIEKESLMQILMPLFRETDCQVLEKSDRHNIFSIVAYLVENHFEVVATMGFDFVFGIISIADGETDPINLLLLFNFLPSFLKNINLGHLMEETFDLLSCYFPIDYDMTTRNVSVTRRELTEGLMNCLVARPDFADLCIPLIFDKLASTTRISKIDSYILLKAGCSTFSVESVSKHSNEIWKVMQRDILPPMDPFISDTALKALSEVVKLFASSDSDEQLKKFLDDIITCIKKFFYTVENSMFRPAMNILLAVSSKSVRAAKYVIGHLRIVIDDINFATYKRKKIALSSLGPFLPILKALELPHSNESDFVTLFNDITLFHIKLVTFEETDIQKLALIGLQELIDGISSDLRKEVLKAIISVMRTECCQNRAEFLKTMRHLARVAPYEILKYMQTFRVRKGSLMERSDIKALGFTVSAVGSVAVITEYAIPELVNIITKTDYFVICISDLLDSIKMTDDNQFLKKIHTDYNMIDLLITWWINNTAERKIKDSILLKNLAEIVALIIRCQETCFQQSIIDRFIPLLLPGLQSGNFKKNVFLIEAILNSVEHIERFDQFPLLGSRLISLALKSCHDNIRKSSSRLLASIANKMSDNLPEWLNTACDEIFSCLNDSTSILLKNRNAYLLNWIVKGLLIADSPYLESFIPKWFDLLEDESVGLSIANGFKMVLANESLYLNFKSHCNVKILYRQKFFTYFPMLMKKFESSKSPYKANYLYALIQLIQSVPKHVAATEITDVVIVLSQALDAEYAETILLSTKILEEFLKDKETILINYTFTFLPKLLKLGRTCEHMNVRMSALRCVFFYGFYPTVSIFPLKKEVIRSLIPCLDDKKRLVRIEAVRSRNRWFLVGAPGEDDIFS